MAFSRLAAKSKAAPAPPQDPEAAAWQAQLAKEEAERQAPENRRVEEQKKRLEEEKKRAEVEDARWKGTHQMYTANLANSAGRGSLSQAAEEKARQQRIERSKAEAAKRATAGAGGGFGAGSGRSDFSWKKNLAPAGGYASKAGGVSSRAAAADMGDLPSHDDCELAVSAMISRTLQGMKEGLRQLGLPDYPLKFIPGRELHLCGHDVREVVNEMIHAWMTDEKDEFLNVLLRVKSIVANPILTEEEMALMDQKEGWSQRQTPDGIKYAQSGVLGVDVAAKPKPNKSDDSDDEVIDLSNGLPTREDPPRAQQHSFAKPVPTVPATAMDGEDPYALLGISPTASLQEIRMKFRQLVVTEHPEKGGDPKKFAKLNRAYGLLSDQEKRRQYDEQRSTA